MSKTSSKKAGSPEREQERCGYCESTEHTTASHEERLDAVEAAREIEYNEPPERQSPTPKGKGGKKKAQAPAVELGIGTLEDNVSEAIKYLVGDPDLYQRSGELTRVVRITGAQETASKDAKGNPTVYAGTPTFRDCPAAHMIARMSTHVPCRKWSKAKKEFVPCDPPMRLVNAVLVQCEYPGIRYLQGVTETPFLRPDGTICQRPGHDKTTGYLYAPTSKFPEMPDKPSQKDAARAYKKLLHIYKGLEFVSEAAMAVPIAGILTIFAQAAIKGCIPVMLMEANTPGTGKTNVVDTVGIIASDRPMPRRTFPGPNDELRKVLDSYARDGMRFFLLDNITQDFGGDALESAVTTEGEYDIRVLGETRNIRVDWHPVIFGTGNNIGFYSTDIIPRVLVARMTTKSEDPRSRDVSEFLIKEELKTYVRRNRIELAVAALTILRAYTFARRPKQDVRPWGSFEAWNALIPPAIVFAGGPDVNECRLSGERAKLADVDGQHLALILDQLPSLYARLSGKPKWASAGAIIEAAYEVFAGDGSLDDLRRALQSLTTKKHTGEHRPNAQGLGFAFRRMRDRVVGGKRLVDMFDRHLNAQLWGVESAMIQ